MEKSDSTEESATNTDIVTAYPSDTEHTPKQRQSIANLTGFLQDRARMLRWAGVTGPTLLYGLSALSIVYGITQVIGEPLATSFRLGDILPSLAVVNLYEIALLVALWILIRWRNATEDSVSLVILMALFLVASGMILGVIAPSGLDLCVYLGVLSVLIAGLKLYVLRGIVKLPMGGLTLAAFTLLVLWNFLAATLMARPLMAQSSPDELRRVQWLSSWIIIAIAALLCLVDGWRKNKDGTERESQAAPFLQTAAMTRLFFLILLTAIGFHQFGIAYMFAVEYSSGDFLLLIILVTLLVHEVIDPLVRRLPWLSVALACGPLVAGVVFFVNRQTASWSAGGLNYLFSAPSLLAFGGMSLLALGMARHRPALRLVSLAYGLGVLFACSPTHVPNWRLFGLGLILVLLCWGLIRRDPLLCLAGVIVLTLGLLQTDTCDRWLRYLDMNHLGLAAGMVGMGMLLIALHFGPATPRPMPVSGILLLGLSVVDFLPQTLGRQDVFIALVLGLLYLGLWWRLQDPFLPTLLGLPEASRLYLVAVTLPAWGFVILSFVLLILGTSISLCHRRRPENGGHRV